MSIIIYGPQGCGKTKNAERLRKFFKCDRVFDGALFADFDKGANTLYLTNEGLPDELKKQNLRRVIKFSDAMTQASNNT